MKKNRFTDAMGLRLSRQALRVLRDRGIFAQSSVSLQHQHLANRYVVRGLESGGAAGDVGRYVTFAEENGQPIEYLHPVEAIGVNGVHAVVVAPVLVRLDMLRKGRTYELLITRHQPSKADNGHRPQLETNDPLPWRAWPPGTGPIGKGQGRSGRGIADVLFAVRRGDRDTGAFQAGGPLDHQSSELHGLLALPLRPRTTQRPRRENRFGKARRVRLQVTPPEHADSPEAAINAGSSGETMPVADVA